MTIVGAYLGAHVWRDWNLEEARAEFSRFQRYGVNTIFSEADHYRRDIIQIAHDIGLRFMGGLTCFKNDAVLSRSPELRPVGRDGQLRPRMNWYVGITPTHQPYAQSRLEVLSNMTRAYELDGIWLDFIRWPLHWEQELRADTPVPLEASFDDHSLERFSRYSAIDIPAGTTKLKADWILRAHRREWIDFKCHVITDFVAQAKTIVKTSMPDKPFGLDIVPARSSQRERLLGQRLPALSAHADCFSPMLYHHVLGFSPAWMTEVLDELAAETAKPLLPFVQVDAFSQNDDAYSAREWDEVLRMTLSHARTVGLIAFTGEMLHVRGRGRSFEEQLGR